MDSNGESSNALQTLIHPCGAFVNSYVVVVAQDTSAIGLKAELNSILEGKGKVTKSWTAYSLVPGRCTGGTSERGHEHVWCEEKRQRPL